VLVSSLYLASAIAQPTASKLSEEFGPRRVFLTGISTFGYIGSIASSAIISIVFHSGVGDSHLTPSPGSWSPSVCSASRSLLLTVN
jgi:MFS family permease